MKYTAILTLMFSALTTSYALGHNVSPEDISDIESILDAEDKCYSNLNDYFERHKDFPDKSFSPYLRNKLGLQSTPKNNNYGWPVGATYQNPHAFTNKDDPVCGQTLLIKKLANYNPSFWETDPIKSLIEQRSQHWKNIDIKLKNWLKDNDTTPRPAYKGSVEKFLNPTPATDYYKW